MTDKVQKIREEVERLKGWNNNVRNSTRHMTLQEEDFNRGKHSSYLEILDFIDSLQEEPVSIDFEQELYKAFGQVKDFTLGMRIAKRFYEIGRNHQEPVSEDLEEAAIFYADTHTEWFDADNNPHVFPAFKAGAKWDKEQMMARAVDGVVHHFEKCKVASVHYNDPTGVPMAYFTSTEGLSAGDKVKIIVIKED